LCRKCATILFLSNWCRCSAHWCIRLCPFLLCAPFVRFKSLPALRLTNPYITMPVREARPMLRVEWQHHPRGPLRMSVVRWPVVGPTGIVTVHALRLCSVCWKHVDPIHLYLSWFHSKHLR
jgi:hypothetical protein